MSTLHNWIDTSAEWGIDDYLVKRVSKKTAQDFIGKYHYAGGTGNAIMAWGLFENVHSQLVGVIAFQTPISENTRASVFEDIDGPAHEKAEKCDCEFMAQEHYWRDHVTELHRMALHPDCPPNSATWFISRALDALKDYKPKYRAAISLADSTEGHDGTVYQAANADYYGTTGARKSYRDANGDLRTTRQCGKNITVEEAKARGWTVDQRGEKHRYVFWLSDWEYSKEELREKSQIELQPYP